MFTPFGFMTTQAGGGGDVDADAYILAVTTAGGTLSAGDETAIQTLFTDLKTAGIYSKTYAMYPYAGGVAGSHILNANLNTSYNQIRSGGWTDNTDGATPNGINASANTQILPSSVLTLQNTGMWTYVAGFGVIDYTADLGTGTYSAVNPLTALIGGTSNPSGDKRSYFYMYNGSDSQGRIMIAEAVFGTGEGFIGWNRQSATDFKVWVNGSNVASSTTSGGALNTTTNIFAPAPSGGGIGWANRRHQFDAITEGLTDVQATSLSTIVNDYQTSLGRNLY